MALRDQPYLPLYVQDFLTDERLNECSAESTGVYIRLMCLMHKSQEYGTILLKQKDKQSGEAAKDFAVKLARQMPYSVDVIERALRELLEEEVLHLDGDRLFQRRMVKDGKLSAVRQEARRQRRSDKSQTDREDFVEEFVRGFVPTKPVTNAENETESETDTESEGEYENEVGINTQPAPARTREGRGRAESKYLAAFNRLVDLRISMTQADTADLRSRCESLPLTHIINIIETGGDWPHIKASLQRLADRIGDRKT